MKKLATVIAAIALIGTPAFAADMALKAPPPPPAPIYSWTGFYAGLNAGWSWGKQDTTVNFPGPVLTSVTGSFDSFSFSSSGSGFTLPSSIAYQESTRPTGAIGGVQIGYNWQTASNWIFGIEADFQASGENASGNAHQTTKELVGVSIDSEFATFNAAQSISQMGSLLWFGTVRGRIGYAVWPTVMLYGTGGLAYGRLNKSVSASFNVFCTTNTPPCTGSITLLNGPTLAFPVSGSQGFEAAVTKTGWTVGGGIEGVVPNTHVTLKAEYLYMDLGTENFTFSNPLLGTILVSSHFTDNIVRVGLNYQFH